MKNDSMQSLDLENLSLKNLSLENISLENFSLKNLSLESLAMLKDWACPCGQQHSAGLRYLSLKEAALRELPGLLAKLNIRHPFVFADVNTWALAGADIGRLLDDSEQEYAHYVFPHDGVHAKLEPDEKALGRLLMAFDTHCDGLIALGSGTLNDLGKLLAARLNLPYVIVATAPSMDGYASASSSMIMDGLKISLGSRLPDAIVADIDLIRSAPPILFQSGLGDMLAKSISLCDWKLSALITGEHFCPEIAALVEQALQRCLRLAPELEERSAAVTAALMEGLILSGLGMALAGNSRPASGVEHYFSHIWDMRGAALGETIDTHGRQCLIGSLLALRLFDYLRRVQPDAEKALAQAAAFDEAAWAQALRELLGASAEALIVLEKKEGKYASARHKARLERILQHWPEILRLLDELLPDEKELRALLSAANCPLRVSELHITHPEVTAVCRSTGDIRDKYIVSRLLWDLGLLDEAAEWLAEQEVAK